MSEKASQSYIPESLKDSSDQLTSSEVLDGFADKRKELTANLDEIQVRPGFKLNANETMAKRREEKAASEELGAFTAAYNELGGADIDAAQAAVDALDFKADASDHVRAKAALTAARNKFYENFLASQQEAEVADIDNSSEDKAGFDVDNEAEAAKQRLDEKAAGLEAKAVDQMNDTEQAKQDRELLDKDEPDGGSEYIPKHRTDVDEDDEASIYSQLKQETEAEGVEAKEGKHRADTGADELEILDIDDTGADDLEVLDEGDASGSQPSRSLRDRVRSAGAHARRMASPVGFFSEAQTSAYVRRRERNGRLLSRRERIAAAMGGAALLIGGGLLLLKGHDIFSGNGHRGGGNGNTPDVPPSHGGGNGAGTPEVVPQDPGAGSGSGAETVHVNPGDGEIKVTQRILANHGIEVNTTDAQRIGESAGVHDILKGDSSYAHSGSTMDRIGTTGDFKVRKGVTARLIESASKLGFRR